MMFKMVAVLWGHALRGCCRIVHHYNVALMVTDLIVYGSHDERRRLASAHVEL
jgi:hypothetical protein